jgi:hypothetical protein
MSAKSNSDCSLTGAEIMPFLATSAQARIEDSGYIDLAFPRLQTNVWGDHEYKLNFHHVHRIAGEDLLLDIRHSQ